MSRIKRCGSRRLPGRGDRVLGLLPERAHRSLDALSELRAIFDSLYEFAGNPTKPVTAADISQTRRNIRELTKVGEREIHEAAEDRAARVGQVRRMRAAKTVHALRFSLECMKH